MKLGAEFGLILVAAGFCAAPAKAQDGGALFNTYCAICHEAGGNSQAPGRDALGRMAPEQILQALERGSMKAQAAERSRAQRRALAEYLSGKPLPAGPTIIPASAFCTGSGDGFAEFNDGAESGMAGAPESPIRVFSRRIRAGMTVRDVPNLKLKWAFGLPGATSGGTQPVVANGRVYVGDAEGDLFALDAKSGCIFWHIEVEAGIRSAITLG